MFLKHSDSEETFGGCLARVIAWVITQTVWIWAVLWLCTWVGCRMPWQ